MTTGLPMYRTVDGGETWRAMESGIGGAEHLVFAPNRPGTLFAAHRGAYGTIARSLDSGATWEGLPEAPVGDFRGLAIDNQGTLWASVVYEMSFHIVYQSFDGGDTWQKFVEGLCVGQPRG